MKLSQSASARCSETRPLIGPPLAIKSLTSQIRCLQQLKTTLKTRWHQTSFSIIILLLRFTSFQLNSVYNNLPFFGGVFVLWAFPSEASTNLFPTEAPSVNGSRRKRSADVMVAYETEIWVRLSRFNWIRHISKKFKNVLRH